MEERSFADLGRIEAIRLLFEGSGYTAFNDSLQFSSIGAGDKCVNASRSLLEGTDFDLVYFPLKHLGHKAVVSVTGELYASMATARTLSVILGVSAKLDFPQIAELWSGVLAAAHQYGYSELSLDLIPSRNGLSINISACGSVSRLCCVRRPAPKSKDLLCVSGSLGAAFLGMQVLERERRRFDHSDALKEGIEQYRMLVGAYLHPELNADIPSQLEDSGIYPSAGMWITRGLADAVLRISRSTGLGAKIYADKMPFEGGSFTLGKELDLDPISAAMNGGDDMKLLFAVPILQLEKFRHDFQTFDIIGHLALPEAGCSLVTPEGVELGLSAPGWNNE